MADRQAWNTSWKSTYLNELPTGAAQVRLKELHGTQAQLLTD